MADMWLQGSFAFLCTLAEGELMAEAIAAGCSLCADMEPEPPSANLLATFPPTHATDPWSGFRDAFTGPGFPVVGGDFTSEPSLDDSSICIAQFSSMVDFDPEAIATVIQQCCSETLAKGPIGFEWAVVCSKPRAGHFGGGWCAVHSDRIEFGNTEQLLVRALEGRII